MCYFLYIASPLTLSEVRSMLPSGLTADLASGPLRTALEKLHPPTRTVARLLVGACSCDLVRPRRADPIEDERELRSRYRRIELPRAEVIRELELHRQGPSTRPVPAGGWMETLGRFVAEHGRNAGPTLYLLDFGPQNKAPRNLAAPGAVRLEEVRLRPREWLVEGIPTVVE